MKNLTKFSLLALFVLSTFVPTLSYAQVATTTPTDTHTQYIQALQSLITLLEQQVASLVAQMQSISNNQAQITAQLAQMSQVLPAPSVSPVISVVPPVILVDGSSQATTTETIVGGRCQILKHTFSIQNSDGTLQTGVYFNIIASDGKIYDRDGEGPNTSDIYAYMSPTLHFATATGTAVWFVTAEGATHEFDTMIIDPSATTTPCANY